MPISLGDLQHLIGSFVGDATPQKNPNYTLDANGQPVDPSQTPYSQPGWTTKFFHPEVAQYEAQQNLGDYNAQLEAQRKVAATRALYGNALDKFNDPNAANILATGGYEPYNVNVRQAGDLASGVPQTQSQSDVAEAVRNLQATQAALGRQPVVDSTQNDITSLGKQNAAFALRTNPQRQIGQEADIIKGTDTSLNNLKMNDVVMAASTQEAVNRLAKDVRVDPQALSLEALRLRGELGREPEEEDLLKATQDLKVKETVVNSGLANTRLQRMGELQKILGNQISAEAFQSNFMPPSSFRTGTRINPEGTVTPGVRVPGYVNPEMEKINAMQDLKGGSGLSGSVKLPNGAPLPRVSGTLDLNGNPVGGNKPSVRTTIAPPVSKTGTTTIPNPAPTQPSNVLPSIGNISDMDETGNPVQFVDDLIRMLTTKPNSNSKWVPWKGYE